jgi:hypothetical protein
MHQVIVIKHEFDSDCLLLAFEEFESNFLKLFQMLRSRSFENDNISME